MMYNYLSDLLKEAQENKSLDVLIPIIQKYDKEYRGKKLCGDTYKTYVESIAMQYHSTILSKIQEGNSN